MRYGALDIETGKSLTQLEYEEAKRYRLPTLIYLIDEDRQPVLPKYIDFGESGEKLRSLKEKLKHNHVVSFFTTPDDLAMKVTQDLSDLLQQQGANVEKGALAKIVGALPKVDWLDEERFAFLKERIGNVADPIGSDEVLHEALQFLLMDDRLSAVFLIAQSTGLNIRQSIDLMLKVHVIALTVALEGYRKMEKEGKVPAEFLRAFEAHVLRTRDSLEVIETGKKRPESPPGAERRVTTSEMKSVPGRTKLPTLTLKRGKNESVEATTKTTKPKPAKKSVK